LTQRHYTTYCWWKTSRQTLFWWRCLYSVSSNLYTLWI